ncbi:MAG: hypothetical protein KJ044_00445, partial [Planctomycetes bacterium]|nr:hypothetical protein [Planctomycetota bacterium]
MRKIAIAGLFALILAGCGNPADSNITANPLPQAARVPAATQPLATAPDPAAADRPAPAQPDDTTIQQPPEPAPQPKPALPEVPAGEKKDDGLWFALPFERGQGSLRLARQNDLLRVDVHVRLPYYAGDAARDRGTVLDLILSVDGANGRRLLFYPSPAWQPGPEPLMFRSEATYNKTAGMARLTEQPSFGARADVKYWDEWKATLYVDLRLVVVPGSTPASVADSWRAALIAGNQAARLAFPQGLNDMNPGLTPERMVTFKFSDLPRLADADESPRESAIEDEKEQQDAMRALTAVTQKRDFGGLQKKTREYIKTWPDALWLRFLDYLVARGGYEN